MEEGKFGEREGEGRGRGRMSMEERKAREEEHRTVGARKKRRMQGDRRGNDSNTAPKFHVFRCLNVSSLATHSK